MISRCAKNNTFQKYFQFRKEVFPKLTLEFETTKSVDVKADSLEVRNLLISCVGLRNFQALLLHLLNYLNPFLFLNYIFPISFLTLPGGDAADHRDLGLHRLGERGPAAGMEQGLRPPRGGGPGWTRSGWRRQGRGHRARRPRRLRSRCRTARRWRRSARPAGIAAAPAPSPTLRGRAQLSPWSGVWPRVSCGMEKRAVCEAMTMSAISTICNATPMASRSFRFTYY